MRRPLSLHLPKLFAVDTFRRVYRQGARSGNSFVRQRRTICFAYRAIGLLDQENNPDENETELLARKTIEHGLEGRVFGVHAISLGAKPLHEQDRVIELLVESKLNIICCPSAALSMKALPDRQAPIHNSIAPVPKLIEAGVPVFLGMDNIADLFMPMVDADLWFECRMLMEACRFYQLEAVADIASRRLPS